MAKTHDVFDYLNVSEKEDVYTVLIYHAFLESESFRRNFCAFFGAQYDKKAKLLLRSPFQYETVITKRKINKEGKIVEEPHRHKRQIPDLTLITADKICIIESKLFAGEGSYQTERYGDIRFLESIKQDKKLATLDLSQAKLHSHRCKTIDDQCLFYVTINGDRAYNEAFMSIRWSDLISQVFVDLSELNERLQPILVQMRERFASYPILLAELLPKRSELDLDAYLRQSAKHFLLNKDYLLFAYFDELREVRQALGQRDSMRIDFTTVLGSRQLIVSDTQWDDPSFEAVLQSQPLGSKVSELLLKLQDEPYPFSRVLIKVVNNRKIAVTVNVEPNPYLSEAKLIRAYGNELTERFKEGKALFEQNLQAQGFPINSTLLQVTKTEFSKKDKDLVDKVIAQILSYIRLIDTLTQKEPRYE